MFEFNACIVAALICFPAFLLMLRGSSGLVDYIFFVVALNRGIRRVVDYQNGYFNQYSMISLTPIIVGGFAVIVIVRHLGEHRFGLATSKMIVRYGVACGMAFIVGFLNVRLASVYALGEYIAPIGLIGFGALYADQPAVINRWCNSLAIATLLVAVYGLYQFYTIPPWDAFWVREVDFEGYLGSLEPTKMTLFSTMSDRGPAATFLCGGLIVLILRPTLGIFRFPAAGVILLAMILTYSRTTVIQTALAVILFPLINRGTGASLVICLCLAALLFGDKAMAVLPTQMASSRIATIGNITEDHSFQGRLALFAIAGSQALSEPLGLGIGSHGLGLRVASGGMRGAGDSTGYVEALRTFGFIGFYLIASVLAIAWTSSAFLMNYGEEDHNSNLFRAWFVSGMVALFSGTWLFTATFFWVLAGTVTGRRDEIEISQLMHSPEDSN